MMNKILHVTLQTSFGLLSCNLLTLCPSTITESYNNLKPTGSVFLKHAKWIDFELEIM